MTQQVGYKAGGATVVDSLSDAFLAAQDAPGAEETFVIGGGEIYAAALPYATRLYLTLVDDAPPPMCFSLHTKKILKLFQKKMRGRTLALFPSS